MNESDKLSPAERRNRALRAALRAGDPAAGQAALTEVEVERLRRRLHAAQEEGAGSRARRPWLPLVAVAASIAVLWVVALGRRAPELQPVRGAQSQAAIPAAPVTSGAAAGEVRQMQFETPGGTRIIWVMAARLD